MPSKIDRKSSVGRASAVADGCFTLSLQWLWLSQHFLEGNIPRSEEGWKLWECKQIWRLHKCEGTTQVMPHTNDHVPLPNLLRFCPCHPPSLSYTPYAKLSCSPPLTKPYNTNLIIQTLLERYKCTLLLPQNHMPRTSCMYFWLQVAAVQQDYRVYE